MSRWAFRLLLWYICVLFTQPQNRFLFLYPLHIADICVIGSFALHALSAASEDRPLFRMGPATVVAIFLMTLSYLSLYIGALQLNSSWNSHIDILFKSVIVMIMIDAMADTIERVWAVQVTILVASLWWIKGGLRLAAAGSTYAGDRIMGPAVGLVENPNGFAYMLCVILPIYLYMYQQVERKWLKLCFVAISLADVYLVLKTGSRTGLMILVVMLIFLLPKYGARHKTTLIVGGLTVFLILPHIGAMNVERFKSIPQSIGNFFSGSEEFSEDMDQDAQSARERGLKNRHTWRLIMQYPLFGVGMLPDETKYPDDLWGAWGQVHCEILMAGKQMGVFGMGIYVSLLYLLIASGLKGQEHTRGWWPAASDLGWTFKLQGIAVIVGGAFSPIPWNAVTFILVGSACSFWRTVRVVEPAPQAEVEAPSAPEPVAW